MTSASLTSYSKSGKWFPALSPAGALRIFHANRRRAGHLLLLAVCLIGVGMLAGCGGITYAGSGSKSGGPTITTQPANQTVTLGQTATFAVVATGTGSLTYQWSKNGAAITGATAASYTTPDTATGDNGAGFTVVVSNAIGSVTSSAATLTVTGSTGAAPTITTQPANQTVTVGQTATFAVVATSTGSLTYQWSKNAAAIAGATAASYTTPDTATGDNGASFTVVVSNAIGSVTSSAATLTVTATTGSAPTITTQPANQTVTVGQTATFTVVATGTGTLTYRWSKNGSAIADATAPSYTTPNTAASDSGASFTVVVSNAFGYLTSNAATLTVTGGGGGTDACSSVANLTVNGATYTPQWCQEFNDTTAGPPDTSVWGFDLGNNNGWGNGEAEVYCGPPGYANNPSQCPTTFSTATAPVYVDGNGHLVIQPIYENGAWLSGRMQTYNGQQFSYGIFEASIELPDTTDQGLWPAFWTLGSDLKTGTAWPSCGEADIMENWSPQVDNGAGTTGNNSTIHTMDTGGSGVGQRYTFPTGQAANTAFHTYGAIWTQNEMQFFVDDPTKPFYTATPGVLPSGDVWPFNQTIFTILNVAVGGTLGGSDANLTNPGPMTVDYVRWYTTGSSGGGTTTPTEGSYGGTTAAIPGTVMAENYDTGGQGIAYNVTSTNGSDNSYRSDGVDLELATAPATGNDVGWTAAGQWFKYTVNVATAGIYNVNFLVAAPAAVTDAFHIADSSGTNLTGSINVPATGGYEAWQTVTATLTLPAGVQTLTLDQDAAGWNIDSTEFAESGSGGSGNEDPYSGTPAAIPGTVMVENYDTGGQGVAYNVTSTNGTDNGYRNFSDGVDLELASPPATDNDIGWTAAGQWFRYTVNVSTAGAYTVSFLVAAPSAVADAFHIANSSGTNLTGSVEVPASGGDQDWTTVTATLTLPAGVPTLTLDQDNSGWNIDSIAFVSGTGGSAPTKVMAPFEYAGGARSIRS